MNNLLRQHLGAIALLVSVVLLCVGKAFTAVLFCACLVAVRWLLPKGRIE